MHAFLLLPSKRMPPLSFLPSAFSHQFSQAQHSGTELPFFSPGRQNSFLFSSQGGIASRSEAFKKHLVSGVIRQAASQSLRTAKMPSSKPGKATKVAGARANKVVEAKLRAKVKTKALHKAQPKLTLPLELIPNVFRFAWPSVRYKMILVSRPWHDMLIKLFYSEIFVVFESDFHLLFRTLNDNLERFRWITSFEVYAHSDSEEDYTAPWSPDSFVKLSTLLTISHPDRVSFTFSSLEPECPCLYTLGWSKGELTFDTGAEVEEIEDEVHHLAQTLCWIYADEAKSLKSFGGYTPNVPTFKGLRTIALRRDQIIAGDRTWYPPRNLDQWRLEVLDPYDRTRIVSQIPRWTRSFDVDFLTPPMMLPRWPAPKTPIPSRVLRYAPPRKPYAFDKSVKNDWRSELAAYKGGGALEIMFRNGVLWNAYYETIEVYIEMAVESKKFPDGVRRVRIPDAKRGLLHVDPLPLLDIQVPDVEYETEGGCNCPYH
ncbi:uncharacterized protein EV422DRAFT_602943 [Fimicolochytrium jonesii]|uniref:uncharacterized protein n=1 Tax=Fimicolochytrium jonesii TaxID=1396493 RepID=UPI0022FF0241|nr:uncharacterized protein EV422DRAFT_602943 [Fimicolochytrium jonesii]KAI8818205.1 hypothetical protein EV422DRAFT_602943 [Fimicolochytrium jonesii]